MATSCLIHIQWMLFFADVECHARSRGCSLSQRHTWFSQTTAWSSRQDVNFHWQGMVIGFQMAYLGYDKTTTLPLSFWWCYKNGVSMSQYSRIGSLFPQIRLDSFPCPHRSRNWKCVYASLWLEEYRTCRRRVSPWGTWAQSALKVPIDHISESVFTIPTVH